MNLFSADADTEIKWSRFVNQNLYWADTFPMDHDFFIIIIFAQRLQF